MTPRLEGARLVRRACGARNFRNQVLRNEVANLPQNAELGTCWLDRLSFHPRLVAGLHGRANTFFVKAGGRLCFEDKNNCYLAAFNYSDQGADLNVNFSRIGLKTRGRVEARELWRGAVIQAAGSMTIKLAPADTALYKFCGKPELK